jgi:hypothetical protein
MLDHLGQVADVDEPAAFRAPYEAVRPVAGLGLTTSPRISPGAGAPTVEHGSPVGRSGHWNPSTRHRPVLRPGNSRYVERIVSVLLAVPRLR